MKRSTYVIASCVLIQQLTSTLRAWQYLVEGQSSDFLYRMLFTSQPFYVEFTRRDFTFQVNYEFLNTFLLLLCKRDVRSTYFGALENSEQDVNHDRTPIARTVFRNLRSASSFLRYSWPTSSHVLEHTPGASSDPSQHSSSCMKLGRGSLRKCGLLTTKTILHTRTGDSRANMSYVLTIKRRPRTCAGTYPH